MNNDDNDTRCYGRDPSNAFVECFDAALRPNRRRRRRRRRRRVHPTNDASSSSSAPKNSEFLRLATTNRLRIVHVRPDANLLPTAPPSSGRASNDDDEYWFTRGGATSCRCSFRRTVRCQATTRIETYVGRLVAEAFRQVFRDFSPEMGRNRSQQQQRPLVLLLHGIGSCADVWKRLIRALVARGHEVIAPDLLGHGLSSTPDRRESYAFASLVDDVTTVFDRYAVDDGATTRDSCLVIGHSFGCSLATALYKHRSAQISQLILISGGGPTPLAAAASSSSGSRLLSSPGECAEFLFKPLIACGLKRRFFYPSRGKHFVPCTDDNALPPFVARAIARGQNWPEGDATYHRRILVPTLLVYGLQDTKVTLVQECEMERTIPRAFLELIPDAGHMVMLDAPDQLAHMVLCFIDWWIG